MATKQQKTYAEVKAELVALSKKAEEARAAEVADVIKRMREAIAFYGISAADLGLKTYTLRTKKGVVKYSDGNGGGWTGHGRRPRWFVNALAAGKTPADLLVRR